MTRSAEARRAPADWRVNVDCPRPLGLQADGRLAMRIGAAFAYWFWASVRCVLRRDATGARAPPQPGIGDGMHETRTTLEIPPAAVVTERPLSLVPDADALFRTSCARLSRRPSAGGRA
jgi:hypothetical protein